MGIFSTLFGNSDVVKKTVDGVYNGADMLVYTAEEQAIARQKKQEFYIKLLSAYEPFKLAQRLLAMLYSIPYVTIVVYCIVVNDVSRLASANDALGLQNLIILGFYFGGGAFEGIIRAKAGL